MFGLLCMLSVIASPKLIVVKGRVGARPVLLRLVIRNNRQSRTNSSSQRLPSKLPMLHSLQLNVRPALEPVVLTPSHANNRSLNISMLVLRL